jgi:flagellar hook assembly protein FlgD
MKSGPNPFTPGIEPVDNPDFDGALKSAHENKGLLIVLSPDTSRIKRQVSINGSIKIFDSFGSTIRKEDFKSNTAKTMVFFFWDGRNSSGRLVGSGTYVANITVQNENGQVEKKKLLVGVKR